jgi:hypothetical protein
LQHPELGRSSKRSAAAIRFCRLLAYQVFKCGYSKKWLVDSLSSGEIYTMRENLPAQWRLSEITVRPPATDKNQGYGQKLEESAGSSFFQLKKTFSGRSTRNDPKLRPGTYTRYVHDF